MRDVQDKGCVTICLIGRVQGVPAYICNMWTNH